MPSIKTVVTLSEKEVHDLIIETAKSKVAGVTSSQLKMVDSEGKEVKFDAAVVSFSHNCK